MSTSGIEEHRTPLGERVKPLAVLPQLGIRESFKERSVYCTLMVSYTTIKIVQH